MAILLSKSCNDSLYLPVSKRRDDKSLCTTQKLILILKVHICDGNYSLVCVLIEIESSLLQPLEVSW